METDLDQAVQHIAESGAGEGEVALGVLAHTPTSSSRRLQESLTLARNLYKRQQELVLSQERVAQLEERLAVAEGDAAATTAARAAASQPQQYLIESIRARELQVQDLSRRVAALEGELERARAELAREAKAHEEVQRDLHGVLARRERLHALQTLVQGQEGGQRGEGPPKVPLQPTQASRGPAWYAKLKAKNTKAGA